MSRESVLTASCSHEVYTVMYLARDSYSTCTCQFRLTWQAPLTVVEERTNLVYNFLVLFLPLCIVSPGKRFVSKSFQLVLKVCFSSSPAKRWWKRLCRWSSETAKAKRQCILSGSVPCVAVCLRQDSKLASKQRQRSHSEMQGWLKYVNVG